MADRFYLEDEWKESITLTGSEAQHLAKVLRKQIGDTVELFDGQGKSAHATVSKISRRDIQLNLDHKPIESVQPASKITLAVAPPKGDRFRWLIEKATELGVYKVIPLQTERSVVRPGGTKLDKLHQTMIAACKQCGRNQLMEISTPTELKELLSTHDVSQPAYFGAIPALEEFRQSHPSTGIREDPIVFVGPEGGFSEEEVQSLLAAGAQPISVSPYILRVETASIALISVLSRSE